MFFEVFKTIAYHSNYSTCVKVHTNYNVMLISGVTNYNDMLMSGDSYGGHK